MRCKNCNHIILKQMLTPDIFYKDINRAPVFSYSYKCSCGRVTVLSEKQFKELEK